MVWNGFKSVGLDTSIVANCATMPHNPEEIERKRVDDPYIPYTWALEHK
jgi:dTDP-4-dehydrorhamnose 3,5-epimerase